MPSRPNRTPYIPIDDRDPSTVRAVILARKSSSGTEDDVRSQVEECEAFIGRLGWKLITLNPYTFAEIGVSGHYNVERPKLDAVLKLAQKGEIDVIVVRELERISRNIAQRYMAIGTANRYGVEWRFANLPPKGRLTDDAEGRRYRFMADEFGEMERDRIVERTAPGREARLARGLPGAGSAGPPYGYAWRPRQPGEKTYSGFIEDEQKSPFLKELFQRVAMDENASARNLALEFSARGVPTPAGRGAWSASTITRLLRNPMYCGRGRTKRWETKHVEMQDNTSLEKYDYKEVHDRYSDPERWATET